MPRKPQGGLKRPQIKKVNSWEGFVELTESLPPAIWIFRGQDKAEYDLQTSLERHVLAFSHLGKSNREMERYLIREFKRRYQHYSAHVPEEEMLIEWLSIMRHHGAPTRLLDWTYSSLVALYFSIENHGKLGAVHAVWCINRFWLSEIANSRLLHKPYSGTRFGEYFDKEDHDLFRRYIFDSTVQCVVPVSPFRLNQRMTLQRGLFLCQVRMESSFMENLMSCDGSDSKNNLMKIEVEFESPEERDKALDRLYHSGISRDVLFPGLDGFAGALGVFHPVLHKRPGSGSPSTGQSK